MDKDEIQQNPDELEQLQGPKRRRGKWRFVLVAALIAGAIAAVFFLREQGLNEQLNEQLRAMAYEGMTLPNAGQGYREKVRGPKWYLKLARKYKLPILKRPFSFSSTTVTDEDMAVVGRAITLRWVSLSCSEISDAGMAHLEGLTKLRQLSLLRTNIGDAGVAHLSKLIELKALDLSWTKVSDAGLAHLKELKNLEVLHLRGTEVTDVGLIHLKSLKRLTFMLLQGTRVTPEGVADLKSAIPTLK